MRPRRSAKSFMAGCHGANIYVPSGHQWPRQFTHPMIPCRGFLRFRFLPTYSAKGFLVVAGWHERMPNGKGRLVQEGSDLAARRERYGLWGFLLISRKSDVTE